MGEGVSVTTRGETAIHPTAIVDSDAKIGAGVSIGPWALIGPGVTIGDGTTVGPRVLIERDTILGEDCMIANGAVLGTDPQDLKYQGEHATLQIGDRTVIREFATLNRGTAASVRTHTSGCSSNSTVPRGMRAVACQVTPAPPSATG